MATTASHSNNYQVYLMGEVPDKTTLPTNTQTIAPGFNLIASPFPVTEAFTNLPAAKNGRNGDKGLIWDALSQTYSPEQRSGGIWTPGTNMISPGQSLWYKSSRITNVTWSQTKPYTWP